MLLIRFLFVFGALQLSLFTIPFSDNAFAQVNEKVDDLAHTQDEGKRLRNLLIICPGMSGNFNFRKIMEPLIRVRVQKFYDNAKRNLKLLISEEALLKDVIANISNGDWDSKTWKMADDWKGYLLSLTQLERQKVLENVYNFVLARLSLHEGLANVSTEGFGSNNGNYENDIFISKDRKQAAWLFKAINPKVWGDQEFKIFDQILEGSRRSEADLIEESVARLDWSQTDSVRPPFGHAYFSCGMNCNSHFVERFDSALAMECFKLDPNGPLDFQLDAIEAKPEFYDLSEVIK